jgi:predicted XRE-type DNA-binding protein
MIDPPRFTFATCPFPVVIKIGNVVTWRMRNKVNPMSEQTYASVWDAICDSPEEAEHMKLRSDLLIKIQEYLDREDMTGQKAAEQLGLTEPRVSYLRQGKIDKFSLDKLVDIATRAGFRVSMQVESVDAAV